MSQFLKYMTTATLASLQALIAETIGSYDTMDLFRHTTELNMHVSVTGVFYLKFLYIQSLYLFKNRHVLNSETATIMFQMRLSDFHIVVSDLRWYCIAGSYFIKCFSPKGSRNQLHKS